MSANPAMDTQHLTTTEAAQRLGISRYTLLRAVRRGEIAPALRTPGGYLRFHPAAVEAYALRLTASREPWADAPAVPAAVTGAATLDAREAFLSSAAHDLKTPLTSILGYTELTQQRLARLAGPDAASSAQHVAHIHAAAVRMARLIDDLADSTRLQMAGGLDLDLQPTGLVALVGAAVARTHELTGHPIGVDVAVPELNGLVDAARVERVVTNLLDNAVKYSPDGAAITVQLTCGEDEGGPLAVIAVHDWGIGIPAADLPSIFQRFQRAGNAVGRFRGTGVGLASAQHIVAQHGGTITAQSKEGVGSTFTVRLPLTPPTVVRAPFETAERVLTGIARQQGDATVTRDETAGAVRNAGSPPAETS